MNPQGTPTGSGDFLSREVRESSTEESIKAELLEDLAKAEEIKAKLGDNTEVKKEYDDVRTATIGALRNLRIETADHLQEVRMSLTGDVDFDTLGDEGNVSETEKTHIDREMSELENLNTYTKPISELTSKEQENLLNITQNEYLNSSNFGQGIARIWSTISSKETGELTYNDVQQGNITISQFQLTLLGKIHGNTDVVEIGYGNGFVLGRNEQGYFVQEIGKFENDLQSLPINKYNPESLLNYFKYLQSEGRLNLETLIEKIGVEKLSRVKQEWLFASFPGVNSLLNSEPRLSWILKGIQNIDSIGSIITSEQDLDNFLQFLPHTSLSTQRQLVDNILWLLKDTQGIVNIGTEMSSNKDIPFKSEIIGKLQAFKDGEEYIKNAITPIYGDIPALEDTLRAWIEIHIFNYTDGEDLGIDYQWVNEQILSYNDENNAELPFMDINELKESLTKFSFVSESSEQLANWQKMIRFYAQKIEEGEKEKQQLNYSRLMLIRNQEDTSEIDKRIDDIDSNTKRFESLINYYERIIQDKIPDINITEELVRDVTRENSIRIQENAQGLTGEGISAETFQAVERMLNSEFSFDEIIAKPSERLYTITSESELKRFFRKFKYEYDKEPSIRKPIQKLQLSDINSNLRNETDILLAFPQKFSLYDLNHIDQSNKDDPYFLGQLLEKYAQDMESFPSDIIENLLQSYHGNPENLLSALKSFQENLSDSERERFQTLMQHRYPYRILEADILGDLRGERDKPNQDINHYLNAIESFDSLDTQFQSHFIGELDAYLEYSNNVEGNIDLIIFILKKGKLNLTTYLKNNIGNKEDIWKAILDYDVSSVRFLPLSVLESESFKEYLIEKIDSLEKLDAYSKNPHLMQHIPIHSPTDLYNFFMVIQNKFPEALGNENQIYALVGAHPLFSKKVKEYFLNHSAHGLSQEVKEFILKSFSAGQEFINLADGAAQKIQSSIDFENGGKNDLKEYLLQNSALSEVLQKSDNLEIVLHILKDTNFNDLRDGDANRLAEIFGDKLEIFIGYIYEYENENANTADNELAKQIIDSKKYDKRFHEYLITHEDGTHTIDIEAIQSELYAIVLGECVKQGNQNGFSEEVSLQFLQKKYGLTQNQAQEVYKSIEREFQRKRRNASPPEAVVAAMKSGNFEDYIRLKTQDINLKTIQKFYPNAHIDESGNISIPSLPQGQESNFSSSGIHEQISTSSDGKSYIDGGDLGKISISEQEANIIRANPNMADTIVENIVNMYTFFKDLNLLGVWDYRFELVNAVGSVHINIQDDFLNETELLNFGKKILKLINKINEEEARNGEVPERVIENPRDLASLNYELSKFSKSRELWGDEKSFNSYGEGRFESWMRNYGIIGGITFHTSTVREMMS